MNLGRSSIVVSRYQRGVALFVALVAMVLLSLAGAAVIRLVETSTSVTRNVAFRQGSIGPVNHAIEAAIDALLQSKTIVLQTVNDTDHGYFALLQPAEHSNGVPDVLAGDYISMKAKYAAAGLPAAVTDPLTLMELRSVIERICSSSKPPPWPLTIESCDTPPPKPPPAGIDGKYVPIPLPPIPSFRVTVRVDLPNSNTVSHAQAFLRASMPSDPGAAPGIRWSWRLLSTE
jgi:type IV pilus assembly protein PilX